MTYKYLNIKLKEMYINIALKHNIYFLIFL